MKYRYKQHPSKYITLMSTFNAGGRVEYKSKYPAGISHMMEHLRFKSGANFNYKELSQQIANFGLRDNAWTSEDQVSYFIQGPEENAEMIFKYLAEIVKNPIFSQNEIDKEKEVVCQEIRMYNDQIEHLVGNKMMETIFDNSVSLPITGTEESVRSITREHILDFNKEFYLNDYLLLSLAAPNNYCEFAEKYFGDIDNIHKIILPDETVAYKPAASAMVLKEAQLQNSILICFGSAEIRNSAIKLKPVHTVFNSIFGSGSTSRLFMSVREEQGLVYSIGSSLDHKFDGTVFAIETSTEPENFEKVMKEIDNQIDIMAGSIPSEDEVQRAKNQIKSAVYSRLDSSIGSISEILNEEYYHLKSGLEFIEQVNKVSAKEVYDLSTTIFDGNKYVVVGAGK